MSRAQAVVDLERYKHENMSANTLRMPRLSKSSFETVLAQVKPMFAEWLTADGIFQANTLTVAKAVTQCWELCKAENPTTTKVGFARYFDTSIPENARFRDLTGNATYNRLMYLLNKVAVRTGGTPAVPPSVRAKQKETSMRKCWRAFVKASGTKPVPVEQVQTLLENMLAIVLQPGAIERVLTV